MWRKNVLPSVPEEQLEYLVITEPIPCGATVIEKSVQGGFERFEIAPGAITFYVGTRRYVGLDPLRAERLSAGHVPRGPDGDPQRLPAGAIGRLDA